MTQSSFKSSICDDLNLGSTSVIFSVFSIMTLDLNGNFEYWWFDHKDLFKSIRVYPISISLVGKYHKNLFYLKIEQIFLIIPKQINPIFYSIQIFKKIKTGYSPLYFDVVFPDTIFRIYKIAKL